MRLHSMEKAKIGVVGLGGRGNHHAGLIASFDNAEVIAVCDLYQDRVDSVSENVLRSRNAGLSSERTKKQALRLCSLKTATLAELNLLFSTWSKWACSAKSFTVRQVMNTVFAAR